MSSFLVQCKCNPDSISAIDSTFHDRFATATSLAEAFQGNMHVGGMLRAAPEYWDALSLSHDAATRYQ
jgi:hypothetical protein